MRSLCPCCCACLLLLPAPTCPRRFSVSFVLNTPPPKWPGGVGFITPDMIRTHLPPPGKDVLVLRCGPAPMNEAMKGHLDELGYGEESQFQF